MLQKKAIGTALGVFLVAIGPAYADNAADRIWHNGPVLTMNDAAMRADAVAVKDGTIMAIGSDADIMKLKGEKTEVIDLAGRAMIPGFVDAHGHIFMGGLQALSANMLPPPDGPNVDIATIQKTLKDWWDAKKELVDKANLIVGFGYDNAQLKELRHPTRDDLNAISKDIPILIVHQSGHIGVVNSKALEVIGYTAATPNPPGGVIQRNKDSQEPNGVLEESAFFSILPKLFKNIGPAGMKALARAGVNLWTSFGYTTTQEGRSSPGVVQAMRAVADEGGFKVDVVTYPDVLVDRDFIKSNISRSYSNHFHVAGAKLTIDGSPQGFTALRDRPYYAPVGNYPPGYVGYAAVKPETVIDAVDWAFANDVQITTHANGEGAGDMLIAAIKAATAKYGPADRRPVLIHGQFERQDQVDSYKALGVFPSLFPMHTFYWGDWHREHTVGPELADNISPTGWYLMRGMMFSSHHDAPVAFPNSLRVLSATVTRRSRSGDIIGPTQRVPVITALKAMTIWPAYQIFEEKRKGSIEIGKLADLVILSDDPTAVDPETLAKLQVVETIKEGQTVFVANDAKTMKKTELMWPKDKLNSGFHEMFRQVFVMRRLEQLPKIYRTAQIREEIEESFDECAEGLIFSDMMGLEARGSEMASHAGR